MRLTQVFAASATLAIASAKPIGGNNNNKRSDVFMWTGVNEAGAEFGNDVLPGQLGKHFTWPVNTAMKKLMDKGFNVFRIATMMERIIPDKLTGTFNETYVQGLDATIDYVTGQGKYAIIDPHNFGRYYGEIITDVDGFGAWWKTVATRYKDNELVIFDTNNEYHDMDNQLVAQLNQAAIDNIRAAGATSQYIFVEANAWSGAWHFLDLGGAQYMKDLTDPEDKIIYELHQYLDEDGSGTHEQCVSGTIGQERVQAVTQWMKENGKKAILGETAGGVNDQCKQAVTGMLSYLEENADVWQGWLWWSAGPWWADYMFSMEPDSGSAYSGFLSTLEPFI